MAKARKRRASSSRSRRKRTSSRASVQSKSRRATRKAIPSFLERIGWDLTSERKRELVGVLFIGLGLFTFLGVFLTSEGLLTRGWVKLLRMIFGEGSYLLPFLFLGIGIWPLLGYLGDRRPTLDVEQIIGLGLLFLVLLALLHAFTGVTELQEAMRLAREGEGGGIIGEGELLVIRYDLQVNAADAIEVGLRPDESEAVFEEGGAGIITDEFKFHLLVDLDAVTRQSKLGKSGG